jgi:hypothetical protein
MVCIRENPCGRRVGYPGWRDPKGLRGCGFFHVVDGQNAFQRGYWDELSFIRLHGVPQADNSN